MGSCLSWPCWKEEVADFLSKGANPNARWEGKTLMHLAAEKDSLPVIRLLVDHGGDVKALTQGEKCTVLHFAGRRPVAEFFVSQGLNVNTNNIYWETPLHLAAKYGYADVVEYLLEKGAEPNATLSNQASVVTARLGVLPNLFGGRKV